MSTASHFSIPEGHDELHIDEGERFFPDLGWVDTFFVGHCSCGEYINRTRTVERLQELHREHREDETVWAVTEGATGLLAGGGECVA